MHRSLKALLLGFAAALLCLSQAQAEPSFTAKVRHVIDGDTIILADGRHVRLAGIDAPETAHEGRPAQYYAGKAKWALAWLVMARTVTVAPVGDVHDRYGRLLAVVTTPDGRSVNESLLANGYASYYWFPDLPEALTARYLDIQRRAMDAGKGFWPRILSLPTPSAPFVGNADSRRVHDPRCPDAAHVAPRHRVAFSTLAAAFRAGYSPARSCTPWPEAP